MKRWQKVLLAVLLVLALVLVINAKLVRIVACNLFPEKIALDESEDWAGGTAYERLAYASDSESQYLDLYVPHSETPVPLFVLVHGGGFISGDTQTRQAQFMFRYFRDRGFACASINYRLAGEAAFPGAIDDVKAAVRFLGQHGAEYGYDPAKTAIWGESAGGYLAAMAALSAPEWFDGVNCIGEEAGRHFPQVEISALVDYYGVMDFPSMSEEFEAQGIPKLLLDIANSWLSTASSEYGSFEEIWMQKAYPDWTEEDLHSSSVWWHAEQGAGENRALKTLILHGDVDITVPYAQSVELDRILQAKYGGERVQFWTLANCGHAVDSFYTDARLAEVEQFLRDSMNLE